MLTAIATVVQLIANLAFWGGLVVLLGIVKLLMPTRELRRRVVLALAWLAEHWVAANNATCDRMLPTKWIVRGLDEPMAYDGRYLIISNHLSWVDIIALFRLFHGRAAFIRFFLKHELIWFPILGQACAALEFPFMKRHSPEYLQRHPEKRGEDLQTARRLCRRYRFIPVAILNFVEGTRFSVEKHADQASPYRHLLRPRTGGLSFAIASLGEQLDAFFDVTLAYPRHDVTMWEFLSGQVETITMHVRRIAVPQQFCTAAVTEPGAVRDEFKEWLDTIWREKDALLDELLPR